MINDEIENLDDNFLLELLKNSKDVPENDHFLKFISSHKDLQPGKFIVELERVCELYQKSTGKVILLRHAACYMRTTHEVLKENTILKVKLCSHQKDIYNLINQLKLWPIEVNKYGKINKFIKSADIKPGKYAVHIDKIFDFYRSWAIRHASRFTLKKPVFIEYFELFFIREYTTPIYQLNQSCETNHSLMVDKKTKNEKKEKK